MKLFLSLVFMTFSAFSGVYRHQNAHVCIDHKKNTDAHNHSASEAFSEITRQNKRLVDLPKTGKKNRPVDQIQKNLTINKE